MDEEADGPGLHVLDPDHWTSFAGYGPLPGIRAAASEDRPPDAVGTRTRVTTTEGSTDLEQIVEWDPDYRLGLDMADFAPPLWGLATRFEDR